MRTLGRCLFLTWILGIFFYPSTIRADCVSPAGCTSIWHQIGTASEIVWACVEVEVILGERTCTPTSQDYNVYEAEEICGGDAGPGGARPPILPNGKDQNRDGQIDCWKYAVDTTKPYQLGVNDELGDAFGGLNTQRHCHTGIDIACNLGDPVYATHAGIISVMGDVGAQNGGNMVSVFADGVWYDHLHLSGFVVGIGEGSWVRAGDPIGFCGNSGCGGPYHLHVRIQGESPGTIYNCPTSSNNGFAFGNPETTFSSCP